MRASARQTILGSDIRQFVEWRFWMHCTGCQVSRTIHGSQLVNARNPRAVCDVIGQLQCRQCGAPPSCVKLFNQRPPSRSRMSVEVVLLGDAPAKDLRLRPR